MKQTDRVRQCDDIVQSEIDGDIVMMSIENGADYGLNEVASRIWAMIAEPTTVQTLCGALHEVYEDPQSQLTEEVLALLDELLSNQIIELT